ncbi:MULTISPECIES: dTDP-4-dehydrorhamnose 3,5-epimerase family protein [unclassified Synechococcus]|uniref:dTDP-4-dehydrorhamnose 3,5-epimerase family protein n=1 Tax=unclassified Synechococcus TaxID=2626047 RepID=UPI0039B0951E
MSKITVLEKLLPDVFLLQLPCFKDHRGDFIKLFHYDALMDQGINFKPAESFLTRSTVNVLRGMHFQVGEAAHDKLVSCIKGKVLDVVVDVRPQSAHFNQPVSVELSEFNNMALLIGKGYAHGFLTTGDDSWMLYSTSTVHCSSLDRGVCWDSIAFDWPIDQPLTSDRDRCHPKIQEL